jgi:hypothetical protein
MTKDAPEVGSLRHNGAVSPRVTDGGDNLQAGTEAGNILNKLSFADDRDCPPAWRLGDRIEGTAEDQNFTAYYTKPMTRWYVMTTVMRSWGSTKGREILD